MKKLKKFSIVLLTVVAAMAIDISCGKKAVSDDAIANDIKAKLYSDAVTKAASINVDVKGGVATLSGDIPGSDVELQAMKLANSATGVRRVDDQMKVNPSLAANQPPTDNPNPDNPAPASSPAPATPPASATPAPAPVASAPPPAPAPTPTPSNPPPPVSAASTEPPPTPAPPPQPVTYTFPAGQHVSVRMIDSVDSGRNQTGQVFRASLYAPLTSQGRTIIPAGASVSVLLTNAKSAGRIKGSSELSLELSQIQYHGHRYQVNSSTYEAVGKGRGKSTAVRTGIGAAAGALIGGLAGGGKGAGIGALVGGGGVAGYQLATHGQQIKVPSETVLNFTLEEPLTVTKPE